MSKKLYGSIKRSLFGNLSVYILQIITMVFYARMFTPEEFGIVASMQVFVIFFQLFSDMGLSPALLSIKKIKNDLRNSVFTFTILLGLLIGLLFYGFTFFLNSYYDNHHYTFYGIFVALAILLQTMTTIPTVAFHRETRFYSIAIVNIIIEAITFLTVIITYQYDWGVLILFVRILLFAVLKFILLFILSYNTSLGIPKLSLNFKPLKQLVRFSSYQFLFNIVNYFSRNLDNILIGKYFGIQPLGIYDKSYQLMRYPLQLITYSINPAIQPILNGEKGDFIISEHNKLIEKLLIISIPIALYLGLNSNNIVLFLFGDQWGDVGVLVSILSFIIPVQMMLSTSGSFFQSINKPQLLFYSGTIAAITNVLFIILGIYLGSLESVAICLCISFTISFIVIYYVLFKYGFNAPCLDFYIIIKDVLCRYLPTILIYSLICLNLNIQTNVILLDLLISGLLIIGVLSTFNFTMIYNAIKPKH